MRALNYWIHSATKRSRRCCCCCCCGYDDDGDGDKDDDDDDDDDDGKDDGGDDDDDDDDDDGDVEDDDEGDKEGEGKGRRRITVGCPDWCSEQASSIQHRAHLEVYQVLKEVERGNVAPVGAGTCVCPWAASVVPPHHLLPWPPWQEQHPRAKASTGASEQKHTG